MGLTISNDKSPTTNKTTKTNDETPKAIPRRRRNIYTFGDANAVTKNT